MEEMKTRDIWNCRGVLRNQLCLSLANKKNLLKAWRRKVWNICRSRCGKANIISRFTTARRSVLYAKRHYGVQTRVLDTLPIDVICFIGIAISFGPLYWFRNKTSNVSRTRVFRKWDYWAVGLVDWPCSCSEDDWLINCILLYFTYH